MSEEIIKNGETAKDQKIVNEEVKKSEEKKIGEPSKVSAPPQKPFVQESKNVCQTETPETPVKGSLFAKFIVGAAFIFACLSLVVSFIYAKSTTRRIASLDTSIWSLERKIDNKIRTFDKSMITLDKTVTTLEEKMTDVEKAVIVTELKRVLMTVQDISKKSSSNVKQHADRVGENVALLIQDLTFETAAPPAVIEEHVPPAAVEEHLPFDHSVFIPVPAEETFEEESLEESFKYSGEVLQLKEKEDIFFGEVHVEPEEQDKQQGEGLMR